MEITASPRSSGSSRSCSMLTRHQFSQAPREGQKDPCFECGFSVTVAKIKVRKALLMFTRFIPALLLASSLLVSVPAASADPGVRLIVPSYDYTPGHAEATLGAAIANNRTIVGTYVFHGQDVGYLILPD